jgi:Ring finger domain
MKRVILFLLISLWSYPPICRAQLAAPQFFHDGRQWYCNLKKEPVVEMVWSEDLGGFITEEEWKNTMSEKYALKDVKPEKTTPVRRCYCWYPTREEYLQTMNTTNGTGKIRSHYCPVQFDYCGVESRREPGEYPPICDNGARKRGMMQQIWRSAIFATAFCLFFIVGSYQGRSMLINSLSFLFSFCIRPLNPWRAHRILDKDPTKANRMILNHFDRESRTREREANAAAGAHVRRDEDDQQDQDGERTRWTLCCPSTWTFKPSGYQSQREQLLQMVRNNEPQQLMLLLPTDPELQAVMLQLGGRERRRVRADARDDRPKPKSLLLKTRVYHETNPPPPSPKSTTKEKDPERTETTSLDLPSEASPADTSDSGHLDDASCSICYLPLEEGERVGLLPHCKHIFHVDCLKIWLTRRNVCPLCLDENIAMPQYEERPAETNLSTDQTNATTTNTTTAISSDLFAESAATGFGGRPRVLPSDDGLHRDYRVYDA